VDFIAILAQYISGGADDPAADLATPAAIAAKDPVEAGNSETAAPVPGGADSAAAALPASLAAGRLEALVLPNRGEAHGEEPARGVAALSDRSSSAEHRSGAVKEVGASLPPLGYGLPSRPLPSDVSHPVVESARAANLAAPGKLLLAVSLEEPTPAPSRVDAVPFAAGPVHSPPRENAASVSAAPAAPALAAAVQHASVDVAIAAPGWNNEFAQKVVWVAAHHRQAAELHLNPPHLGPVEVMVIMNHDDGIQANIQFASPHPVVRETIEAALPRLRDLLADNGIAMGSVTVGAESFGQSARNGDADLRPAGQFTAAAKSAAEPVTRPAPGIIPRAGSALVDTFA
jgi:hypothetical protein